MNSRLLNINNKVLKEPTKNTENEGYWDLPREITNYSTFNVSFTIYLTG
ncbi:MAG: hypothetical protein PHF55_04635 [Bacteroidales bacterium]|jgi:hypothetical protein|nr:hypothetical protein [Bacteroidales bacterium]MDI3479448.1 hypothetical protein [Rikenellaceae bacterium]MDI3545973.1 hypothetical protein [Rikenellaceae bacterium]MDN5356563.1 hypothetical protein [Rikenellaceae bacterium]